MIFRDKSKGKKCFKTFFYRPITFSKLVIIACFDVRIYRGNSTRERTITLPLPSSNDTSRIVFGENFPAGCGIFRRAMLANLARIIMYKGDDGDDDDDDDDGAGVSGVADGGDGGGGGSPLKIRLNINELSLPTAHHLRLGIHAFLRRWLRVSGPTIRVEKCWCACVGVKLTRRRVGCSLLPV